jgi:uncharacterized protein
MSSAIESSVPAEAKSSHRLWKSFERWNRKLHFYSGLFLMFFLWLFTLTGLLLNHPQWTFHEHWKNRKETNYERAIKPLAPEAAGDLAQAQDIMQQLGIRGDILWTTTRADPGLLEFQVRRPGHFFFIKANWTQGSATVRQADVNVWGLMKVLHIFTGNIADDSRNGRDWALTYLWAYSMDVVAVGLIFMVLSSIYMWLQLPRKRLTGAIVLGLGSLTCGLFCVGLRWLF